MLQIYTHLNICTCQRCGCVGNINDPFGQLTFDLLWTSSISSNWHGQRESLGLHLLSVAFWHSSGVQTLLETTLGLSRFKQCASKSFIREMNFITQATRKSVIQRLWSNIRSTCFWCRCLSHIDGAKTPLSGTPKLYFSLVSMFLFPIL